MQATAQRRPLVILAGWLGAQPKFLKRYEALYQGLGFDVLTRIAPPYTIVREVLHHPVEPIQMPSDWPELYRGKQRSVQDLAWEILANVRRQNASFWIFHSFSNGGCFVWERVRDILQSDHVREQDSIVDLRNRLAGTVFDSCPIVELNRLGDALEHCSLMERAAAVRHNGWDIIRIMYDSRIQERVMQRAAIYDKGLRDDPLNIPQLYLYGRDDPLAPADYIDKLVEYRRHTIGTDKVIRCDWEESTHCAHLLKHPLDYSIAVETFVELCKSRSDQNGRSKL